MAATALVLSVVSSLVQVSATGGGLSPPDLQAAQTIYAQRYIDFEGWAMSQGGRTLRTWIEPVEGISRRPLKAEFYARVARPDLAARYRARRGGRITAGVVGGVMIPSGLVGIIGQAFANHGQRSPEVGGYVAGEILIPLGFAGVLVALVLNSHPVPPSEMHALADEYNRDLRTRLGLDPPREPSDGVLPGLSSDSAPTRSAGGAALSLALRF